MAGALFAVAAALLSHAAGASAPCALESEAVRDVRGVALGIIDADNARDVRRVLTHYTPDAVLMPPGEPAVVGREAIRPRYEALFAGFTPQIEGHIEEACAADGFAFVRGRNGGRLVGRESEQVRRLDDAFLMLLRRDADGAWRISHLMWHRASEAGAKSAEP